MPRPLIDGNKCTGCGACVSSCPQGVLDLQGGKAVVVSEESCIGCRVCESVCPEGAVSVQD